MQQVIMGGFNDALSQAASEYNSVMGGMAWNATESTVYQVVPTAGYFSKLCVNLSAVVATGSNTFVFTLMVDGVPSALAVTIGKGSLSGRSFNTAVAVTAGQTVSIRSSYTGAPGTPTAAWTICFASTTAGESICMTNGLANTGADRFVPIQGAGGADATEANANNPIPTAGTLKKLYVKLSADPGTDPDAYSFTLQKGGVPRTLTCTITADATTGNDLVNTVAVAAGDLVDVLIHFLNTPAVAPTAAIGMVFVSDTEGESLILGGSTSQASTSVANFNHVMTGNTAWVAAAAEATVMSSSQKCILSKLYVKLDAAPGNAKSYTVNVRYRDSNGTWGNTGITTGAITGAAVTTGSDTSNTYTTDDFYLQTICATPASTPAAARIHWGMVCHYAPRLIPNLTLIAKGDATTENGGAWAGDATPAADTEFYREAAGSIGGAIRPGVAGGTGSLWFAPLIALDLSSTHIYIWFSTSAISFLQTKANGGIYVYAWTDATHISQWYVDGIDTYKGGWKCYVIDTASTPSAKLGVANYATMSSVARIGMGITTTGNPANRTNSWVDVIRYGDGITLEGGTSNAPATLALIETDELSIASGKAYGVCRIEGGAVISRGKLRIGSTVGGEITYFKDTSKIVIFEDRSWVSATLYDVILQGNASADTEIYFGAKSGTAGISGCVFKSEGTKKFDVTASNTNITKFGLYGCSFLDADVVTLQAYNANKEVLNCNFEACNEVVASSCIVKYCNFINADDHGVLLPSPNYLSYCNFIGCPVGVRIATIDTYDFYGMIFTNCTVDLENSSAGLVTILNDNASGSNTDTHTETGGGSTAIENSVNLYVKVVDENNDAIVGVRVYIFLSADGTMLLDDATDGSGEVQTGYTDSIPASIGIHIRHSSSNPRYYPIQTGGTILASGFSLTAVMIEDLIAEG